MLAWSERTQRILAVPGVTSQAQEELDAYALDLLSSTRMRRIEAMSRARPFAGPFEEPHSTFGVPSDDGRGYNALAAGVTRDPALAWALPYFMTYRR